MICKFKQQNVESEKISIIWYITVWLDHPYGLVFKCLPQKVVCALPGSNLSVICYIFTVNLHDRLPHSTLVNGGRTGMPDFSTFIVDFSSSYKHINYIGRKLKLTLILFIDLFTLTRPVKSFILATDLSLQISQMP